MYYKNRLKAINVYIQNFVNNLNFKMILPKNSIVKTFLKFKKTYTFFKLSPDSSGKMSLKMLMVTVLQEKPLKLHG